MTGEPVAVACECGEQTSGHLRVAERDGVTVTACGIQVDSQHVIDTVPDVVCGECFPQ